MKTSSIPVVLLCGGLGTRLKAISGDTPKPLVSVGAFSFLEFLLAKLRLQGFSQFILASGFNGQQVVDAFAGQSAVQVVIEPKPLGTAGGLRFATQDLQHEPLLVLNGDSFCEIDYKGMIEQFMQHRPVASIALVPANERRDAGFVRVSSDGYVQGFAERDFSSGAYLNAGIYLLSQSLLQRIPAHKACSLEKDIFPKISSKDFLGFPTAGPVYDIGTPERLEQFKARFS